MILKRSSIRLILTCIIVLGLAAPAFPQAVTTGTISVRATDGSGAVIPGVEVTVGSPAMIGGTRSGVTDEQGTYRFTELVIGT